MPIGRGHFISSGGVCGHLRPTDVTGQELRQVMVGRHRVVTVSTPSPSKHPPWPTYCPAVPPSVQRCLRGGMSIKRFIFKNSC